MTPQRQTPDLLDELAADAPLVRMRRRFDRLLEAPPGARRRRTWLALAAAAALLVAGVLLARRATAPAADPDAGAVLALLEAPSVFDRLRGIRAASRWREPEPALGHSLLRRLESDESVSVRLAALDVLLARVPESIPADPLIHALLGQETAIVQAHLAHQLRRRRLLGDAELARLAVRPGIHAATREALTRTEDL